MDALTSHLLSKLDKLLECQRDQSEVLNRIAESLNRGTTDMSPPKANFTARLKWPPFSQMIVGGVISWGLGTAISSYLSHGGDPMVVIEALLKLLS